MKDDRLIPLMLNGKFSTVENRLTYNHLQPHEVGAAIWEDIRKLYGEKIEIHPDTDSLTGGRGSILFNPV